jgi:putative MFS transporter
MTGVTILGIIALILRESGVALFSGPALSITLLIVGSTGVISILLPYAAENYPLRIRGRAAGWVAGCSKTGGLICQGLSVAAAVPSIGVSAISIAVPVLTGFLLIAIYCKETLGRDLRELERPYNGHGASVRTARV